MKPKINTGIWLDSKQAIIIKLNEEAEILKKIPSGIDGRIRIQGEKKQFTRMGKQFFTDEKKEEEKRKHKFNDFYKNIIENVKDADNILILGPAESKIGLKKAIVQYKSFAPELVMMDAESHLTDKQILAKVKDFFQFQEVE